jgi:hypothetical protein
MITEAGIKPKRKHGIVMSAKMLMKGPPDRTLYRISVHSIFERLFTFPCARNEAASLTKKGVILAPPCCPACSFFITDKPKSGFHFGTQFLYRSTPKLSPLDG